MEASLWFSIFVICGLINTYLFFFFSTKNFSSWLSFTPKPKPKPKPTQNPTKKEQATPGSERNLDPETLFSILDRDGDGYITSKELEASFTELRLFANTKEALSEIRKVDTNNDGLIDLSEFRNLYHLVLGVGCDEASDISIERVEEGQDEDEERELKGAFDIFDKNGDGMISAEELCEILTSLGLKKGERIEDCIDMISKVDMNGDGMVNFEEFKRMMTFKNGKNGFSKETNVVGSLLTS